jgi:hypothetical protein
MFGLILETSARRRGRQTGDTNFLTIPLPPLTEGSPEQQKSGTSCVIISIGTFVPIDLVIIIACVALLIDAATSSRLDLLCDPLRAEL